MANNKLKQANNMIFKVKLRKIGNSLGVIIPKKVLEYIEDEWSVNVITVGDSIYLNVITDDKEYVDLPCGVITSSEVVKKNI